jgi:hypothetical protein
VILTLNSSLSAMHVECSSRKQIKKGGHVLSAKFEKFGCKKRYPRVQRDCGKCTKVNYHDFVLQLETF